MHLEGCKGTSEHEVHADDYDPALQGDKQSYRLLQSINLKQSCRNKGHFNQDVHDRANRGSPAERPVAQADPSRLL